VCKAKPAAEKPLHLTTGEGFDDGSVIDVLHGGKLILWNGEREKISESILRFSGKTLRATLLADGLAIPLPAQSASYGSTADLFQSICRPFLDIGLGEEPTFLLSYFVLSTWFSDLFRWIPSLLLHGEWADYGAVSRLLEALCRRSMVLGDFNRQCLAQIPLSYRPTIILVQPSLTQSAERLLANTMCRNGRVAIGTSLQHFDCPRVVCCGALHSDSSLQSFSLKLRIPACHTSSAAASELASRLQPQLLRYRLQNWKMVRDSQFSVDQFTSNAREIAVALGRCVVDDQQLSTQLVHLLEMREEESCFDRAYSKEAAVIESLLMFCFERKEFVRVGDVAEAAEALLKVQGAAAITAKKTGKILRSLGLPPENRKCDGYSLGLSRMNIDKIHKLAEEYDLFSGSSAGHSCATCKRSAAKQDRI
jgi:hypothetical protein